MPRMQAEMRLHLRLHPQGPRRERAGAGSRPRGLEKEGRSVDEIARATGRRRFEPRVVLEGGGETPAVLLPAIERHLADMIVGEVLAVAARDPAALDAITDWCHNNGHRLLQTWAREEDTEFWIRKGHREEEWGASVGEAHA